MGATNFGTIQIGRFNSFQDAYSKAVDEARSYYGDQDGYNGSISTTRGAKLATDSPKYNTKSFIKYEDKKLETLQKYGHCLAVEIKGKDLNILKKQRGLQGKKGIKAFYFFGWAAE